MGNLLGAGLILLTLVGCGTTTESPAPSTISDPLSRAAQPTLPPVSTEEVAPPTPKATETLPPFDEGLRNATTQLLSQAKLGAGKHMLVIKPFIDGTGATQSIATRAMEARLGDLLRTKQPRLVFQPFTMAGVDLATMVIAGTLTPVPAEGQADGMRNAYAICLALMDTKSKTLLSRAVARVERSGVNATPTPFHQESPVWIKEESSSLYAKTCQSTKLGSAIPAAYFDNIQSTVAIDQAITAYDSARYSDALERFSRAFGLQRNDPLRAYNGLYLTYTKLNRSAAADNVLAKLIDYGFSKKHFAIKFQFRPGVTDFAVDKSTRAYDSWLKEIAKRAVQGEHCLAITGHTSPSGHEPLNERLSLLRAELVRNRLVAEAPPLAKRITVQGAGSRDNLVGTGKDDPSDALDRRVGFTVTSCGRSSQYY